MDKIKHFKVKYKKDDDIILRPFIENKLTGTVESGKHIIQYSDLLKQKAKAEAKLAELNEQIQLADDAIKES
jgi:hypothetical protein